MGAGQVHRPRRTADGRRPAPAPGGDQPRGDPRPGRHPPRLHPGTAPDHLRRRRDQRTRAARGARLPPPGLHPRRRRPVEQARRLLAGSGHSRAPVVGARGFDDVTGIVNLRDLLTDENAVTAADVARPPLLLPDSLPVAEALRRFKPSTTSGRVRTPTWPPRSSTTPTTGTPAARAGTGSSAWQADPFRL
ncbi:CBS domain-containing protein [Nonomuraea sp. NPDC004580]|uniref:CBS domain-containing protein n=1 Tax=Nonomuraea sp. NPDC004580 TaxID=3154552 RepID=UPI0033A4405E